MKLTGCHSAGSTDTLPDIRLNCQLVNMVSVRIKTGSRPEESNQIPLT